MLVEIWSDVVCPWCAIGNARFARALEAFEHAADVEVVWRSFELDPDAPRVRDGDYAERLAAKYRTSVSEARAMIDRMTRAGADEGLDFRFDIARPGNTFDAHRLLHLALERGHQQALKQRFLAAYHSEGKAIGDHATLVRLAADTPLSPDEVAEVLASDRYADEVRADERRATEYGIHGVPFFVVDRQFGLSGAQPPELLLKVLRHAWDESQQMTVVGAAGDDCSDGACGA